MCLKPNQINAWPHSFPVRSDIVGISSYDNTAVILTKGYPEIATIYDPLNISPSMLSQREPCVSQWSIVQASGGVIYATPSGLFYIGGSGGQNLTDEYFNDDDWRKLKPETFHSAIRDGEYYAFHEGNLEGRCLIFDLREPNAVVRQLSQYANAAHVMLGTDDLFFAIDDQLQWFQKGMGRLTYRWRSKEHGFSNPSAITCARALVEEFADQRYQRAYQRFIAILATTIELNQQALTSRRELGVANGFGGAINQEPIAGAGVWDVPGITDPNLRSQPVGAAIANGGDIPLPTLITLLRLNLRVYGDLDLVDDMDILDEEPFRVQYADRSRRWSYELTGTAHVEQFDMAGSESELHDGS